MIQKITQKIDVKKNDGALGSQTGKGLISKNSQMQNTIESTPVDLKLHQEYYVNFGAALASKKSKKQINTTAGVFFNAKKADMPGSRFLPQRDNPPLPAMKVIHPALIQRVRPELFEVARHPNVLHDLDGT